MPAEWEPHEATWIAWPHNRDDWPGRFAPDPVGVRRNRAQAERASSGCASWWRTARSSGRRAAILRKVGAMMEAVEFFRCPTDRVWTRDYVPALRQERQRRTWPLPRGASMGGPSTTTGIATPRCRRSSRKPSAFPQFEPDMVLEGGSIDVNGAGLLLTTEECLLSPVQARNPGMKRARDRAQACATTWACASVIWLRNGIAGDDTHGHVDDLARFVSADTVVRGLGGRPRRPQLRAAARERRHPARRPACAW